MSTCASSSFNRSLLLDHDGDAGRWDPSRENGDPIESNQLLVVPGGIDNDCRELFKECVQKKKSLETSITRRFWLVFGCQWRRTKKESLAART